MHLQHKKILIHPGELYFGNDAADVSTLLGSCVAVTLWHPLKHYVGMCHVVLTSEKDKPNDTRYAKTAIQKFYDKLKAINTVPGDYVVEVYGGGNMFPCLVPKNNETVNFDFPENFKT